jgi:hypothetical protein
MYITSSNIHVVLSIKYKNNLLPYTIVNAGFLDQFKQLIQGQNI